MKRKHLTLKQQSIRSEQEIFDDLLTLCTAQGFIYAIAAICLKNDVVIYQDNLKPEDISPSLSRNRLIHTEIRTLIGLMMRSPISFAAPTFETFLNYIEQAENLLEELHETMNNACMKIIQADRDKPNFNPFTSGEVLRESIFYSGDSAYPFQHRDLAPRKYKSDSNWLLQNKGVDLQVATDLCRNLPALLSEHLGEIGREFTNESASEQSILSAILSPFTFSLTELATHTNRPVQQAEAIINAFTSPSGPFNDRFTSLNEFNAAYSYPFIRKGPDEYILLQPYGFAEALYESPFYWMSDDKSYASTALNHRGEFTEAFATERLVSVFGADRVFRNVEICKSKRETAGEIDTLVLFGSYAIVLQAKSKKLTVEARKGNDRQLQKDFKAAIQDAVGQAFACGELLGDPSVFLRTKDGRQVPLAQRPQTIFPMSIVADQYPALAFQAQQFLNTKPTDRITAPLVTDVFALDAMTEMLTSPLRFLSYLSLRAQFSDKLKMNDELTILSFHLKKNLWIENNIDLIVLENDIASSLDAAMTVRRDNASGQAVPDGILKWFEGTPLGRIIDQIENRVSSVSKYWENVAAIDFGLTLLMLGKRDVQRINKHLNNILEWTNKDGELHDITFHFSDLSTGMTIYCSQLTDNEVQSKLQTHCRIRKYAQKAKTWFGLGPVDIYGNDAVI